MAFFNDLGKKIGGAAEVAAEKAKVAAGAAADKAKEIAEVTKLNNEISAEQKQIDKLYLDIGKLIYEKDKDDPNSVVAEQCQRIMACEKSIADLNNKIQQIKSGDQQTANADSVQASPEVPAQEIPKKKFCPNCGAELPAEGKFCQSCGAPINN